VEIALGSASEVRYLLGLAQKLDVFGLATRIEKEPWLVEQSNGQGLASEYDGLVRALAGLLETLTSSRADALKADR
jgi:hypothetical protein